MKKDIEFPLVSGVSIAAVKNIDTKGIDEWQIVLINSNNIDIINVMITSRGYGEIEGVKRETSLLRHSFDVVSSKSNVVVELLDKAVFVLNNEYWISYFIGPQIFDKKFIFLSETINDEFLTFIPDLKMKGVLHK